MLPKFGSCQHVFQQMKVCLWEENFKSSLSLYSLSESRLQMKKFENFTFILTFFLKGDRKRKV